MNKIVFWQLKNGIYVTKPHFVTYWVWIIVPHSGTWHAKGEIFTQEDRKFQFQVGCMSFTTLKQNKTFKKQLKNLWFKFLTCNTTSNEKVDEKLQHLCHFNYNVPWKQWVYYIQGIGCCYLLHHRKSCLYQLFVFTERKWTVNVAQGLWGNFVWWDFRICNSWNGV